MQGENASQCRPLTCVFNTADVVFWRKIRQNTGCRHAHDYCARHRYPVIVIANLYAEHCVLFYDITERDGDITTVSAAVRRIAEAYAELYDLPAHIREHFADQCYYFNFPVISTSPCAANTPNTPPKRCSIICCGSFGQPEKRSNPFQAAFQTASKTAQNAV